ncbi:hypothetical protein [Streptomyces sp. B93]|uniref:hypothetical protein n=1 Tax=Streptomyces sp. B93 TaxID=2824875 RepID=UPI001B38A446|nr:hypothetical protein [Streptomyces sp. B93]MBQ1088544.1 hypothetical protein [Streptomyces sp. B93]
MEPELATLVGAGATTMVGLMVTETWEQARHRLVRLFTRGGDDPTTAAELEESRTALLAAPDDADLTADTTALLRLRLRRLLTENPDTVDELRCLVEEFTDPTPATGHVRNTITGGTQHGPVLQGHSFTNVTFRAPED